MSMRAPAVNESCHTLIGCVAGLLSPGQAEPPFPLLALIQRHRRLSEPHLAVMQSPCMAAHGKYMFGAIAAPIVQVWFIVEEAWEHEGRVADCSLEVIEFELQVAGCLNEERDQNRHAYQFASTNCIAEQTTGKDSTLECSFRVCGLRIGLRLAAPQLSRRIFRCLRSQRRHYFTKSLAPCPRSQSV